MGRALCETPRTSSCGQTMNCPPFNTTTTTTTTTTVIIAAAAVVQSNSKTYHILRGTGGRQPNKNTMLMEQGCT